MYTNSPYNLANVVFTLADKHRDRIAIGTLDDVLTYDRLRALMINFALHMKTHGINRSSFLLLDVDHPLIAVGLALACPLLGCGWAHATIPFQEQMPAKATHILYDGTRRHMGNGEVVEVNANWFVPPPASTRRMRQAFEGYATPHDTWMIAQSSGTTGSTKLMEYSEELIWKRAHETQIAGLPPNPVMVCLFPPLSPPGIKHALRIIAAGGSVIFGYLKNFSTRIRVDCVFGSPHQFLTMIEGMPPQATRIQMAIMGGAAARTPFFAKLLKYFESVCYIYASTEASIVCAETITDVASIGGQVSVGAPLPGSTVQIVDGAGTALQAGTEGEVRLRTDWQVPCYIGNADATEAQFRDGWFYPGDLGFLSETGKLYITGRVNDLLNTGGIKLNPELIDAVIQTASGIRDGACFAEATQDGVDRLATALQLAGPQDSQRIARAVHELVGGRLGMHMAPSVFYVLDTIPRNANGKLERRRLAEMVQGKSPVIVDRA